MCHEAALDYGFSSLELHARGMDGSVLEHGWKIVVSAPHAAQGISVTWFNLVQEAIKGQDTCHRLEASAYGEWEWQIDDRSVYGGTSMMGLAVDGPFGLEQ